MKNKYTSDKRIVLTLDAGGTNFVFSAIQGNVEIVKPIAYPANSHDIKVCIDVIIGGFNEIMNQLPDSPSAISFAFPGPANYNLGIIGNLPNLPAFQGGVPLGPILEERFNLPVFINNDGDLFTYGEALLGFLPELNHKLNETEGCVKKFNNLIGITLGTGFGCGIMLNNKLLVGDNSCGAEIHNTLNPFNKSWNAEESVSKRAILRVYQENAGIKRSDSMQPKDIYDIGLGERHGDKEAALYAFEVFGEALGNSIANVLTLIDGVVVIGGGISDAWNFFAPSMFSELNRMFENSKGDQSNRLSYKVYNLENNAAFNEFAAGNIVELDIPGSHKKIKYDSCPRVGVGLSKLGTNKSIALGAYTYALNRLDEVWLSNKLKSYSF